MLPKPHPNPTFEKAYLPPHFLSFKEVSHVSTKYSTMSSTHILRFSNHNLHQTQNQRASRMPAQSHTIPHMRGHCPNPNSTNFRSSFSANNVFTVSVYGSTFHFYLYNGFSFSISVSHTTNCQNSNQTCKSMSVCLSNHNLNYEFGSNIIPSCLYAIMQLTTTQLFLAQCEPELSNHLYSLQSFHRSGHRPLRFCHLPVPR